MIAREWACEFSNVTPSICIVVQGNEAPSFVNQTLRTFEILRNSSEAEALRRSQADRFLWMSGGGELRPQALEECVWGLETAEWVTWADTGAAPPPSIESCAGPLGVTRSTLATSEAERSGAVCELPWRCRLPSSESKAALSEKPQIPRAETQLPATQPDSKAAPHSSRLRGLRRHLEDADLLSARTWFDHPLRSVTRLLPLRFKEKINRLAGKPVFDLSFYLQFQPRSVLIEGRMIRQLAYGVPAAFSRRRIALCTPHLGFGGAETVLLEIARQFDRSRFELFLVATQSTDSRHLAPWRDTVDHIYDLRRLLPVESIVGALYSLGVNWQWDGLVVQNTALAYSALPALKKRLPQLHVIDVLHNIDEDWDFFSATLDVTEYIDRRVVISEAGRRRLIDMAVEERTIRLIRNGVDLEHFRTGAQPRGRLHRELRLARGTRIILFAAHLIERKRPLLLLDIDREIQRNPTGQPYHFVIAGDGPQLAELRSKIQSRGCHERFSLLGHVERVAPLLADASALIVTSTEEGLPLSIIEALAMEVPVVSSRVGAIDEAVPPSCGILIENDGQEAESFAAALLELLTDKSRRAAMGQAGRVLVEEHYDLRRSQSDYRQLINEQWGMQARCATNL